MMIQGKQRFFAIILLSSLALNFFLGGVFVGKYFGYFSGPKHFPHHPMGPRLHWMVQALPEDSQAKIRPLMQESRSKMRSQMHRFRKARQAVHEQLTAPDFNRELLSKALAILRQEMGNTQQQMHTQLIEIASQLDEKERQQLSEATHRRPRRPPWRRHHDGPPSEMPGPP
ncbi:hypothetical protein, membrane or secreted [Beggiatoa sp. PS]|nr:hypothetical protein, membrane or secreted [Beggiatoa sp. PS]